VPEAEVAPGAERVVLVGFGPPGSDREVEEGLEELAALVRSAGGLEVGRAWQLRASPDPATLVGKGKLEEIRLLAQESQADAVAFDADLTPAQQRNLEMALGVKVLDRTTVVLDIFAQRARSKEGRLQVEMAQLLYRLPRLRGRGIYLSRLGGGIGTRGPGETKLEVDRRRIERRLVKLRRELAELARQRELRRKRRARAGVPRVSLVGYTNAGKSTLLTALSGAAVYVRDELFSTLDPLARRVRLPSGQEAVFLDTVGFLRKLPHHLVEAFRSTLEETLEADLLLHVADISVPDAEARMAAVEAVLEEVGARDIPRLMVLNKADLVSPLEVARWLARFPGSVAISALEGTGIEELLARVEGVLEEARDAGRAGRQVRRVRERMP
jgi:GTP-binding protein HflX